MRCGAEHSKTTDRGRRHLKKSSPTKMRSEAYSSISHGVLTSEISYMPRGQKRRPCYFGRRTDKKNLLKKQSTKGEHGNAGRAARKVNKSAQIENAPEIFSFLFFNYRTGSIFSSFQWPGRIPRSPLPRRVGPLVTCAPSSRIIKARG